MNLVPFEKTSPPWHRLEEQWVNSPRLSQLRHHRDITPSNPTISTSGYVPVTTHATSSAKYWCGGLLMLLFNASLKGLLSREVEFSQCLLGACMHVKWMYRTVCHTLEKKKNRSKILQKLFCRAMGISIATQCFSAETKQSPFLATLTYPCGAGGSNNNINQTFSLESALLCDHD